MASVKPSVPKGTRDFSPAEMAKRNYIFDTIKSVFRKYGYQQIETPAMENLSTLMGKYGDEGDKLIFKILNSGDYLKLNQTVFSFSSRNGENHKIGFWDALSYSVKLEQNQTINSDDPIVEKFVEYYGYFKEHGGPEFSKLLTSDISEKALRYDLTVPFARYVVMHQNDITFPFKRFQVQPVWRADRPQRGRYREFYQCDADVVGSDSLLNEAEFVLIYDEALSKLGLKDFTIKLNNRKILSGIAEVIDKNDNIVDLTVAIDKIDKIGLDGVIRELLEKGFTEADIEKIKPVILLQGSNEAKLRSLRDALSKSAIGLMGCDEVETVLNYIGNCPLKTAHLELDITLARGLNYYTGAIFEVKTNEVNMGSIGGGGRYDDLTGMFGLKGLTGVGISFGADRIYDVMEELKLFPETIDIGTKVLFFNLGAEESKTAYHLLQQLRQKGLASEIYHEPTKFDKQFKYAEKKNIPFAIIIGSKEIETKTCVIKGLRSGEQRSVPFEALCEFSFI